MSLEFVLSKQFERQQRLSNKIFKSALVEYMTYLQVRLLKFIRLFLKKHVLVFAKELNCSDLLIGTFSFKT